MSYGKSFCGCFCLGSCPFLRVWFAVSFDETQVWLGFAGRLARLCDGWFVLICLHFRTFSVFVQMTFYCLCSCKDRATVRHRPYEPQCDIGHTRGKMERMQAGRPALIKKDVGEMLIDIVLDRPLVEAKALVEAPNAFVQAITRIMQDKQNHPVIAQMINPEVNDDLAPSERAASSSGGHSRRGAVTRPLRSQIHNSNKCQRRT